VQRKLDFNTRTILQGLARKKKPDFHTFIRDGRLSVGVQLLKPDQDYGENAHKHDEVYYIIKGDDNLQLGKKVFRVSPGKIFLCPR
jgi:mannose-6-phosphate isomerase-like protein (cupin superfamily)